MSVELEARVRQKIDTLANWMANPLIILAGEQAFVKSTIDDTPVIFKIGDGTKKFSDLHYPDFTVRAKATTSTVWNSSTPAGIYLPTTAGTYSSVTVVLSDGYQVLYWDGTTLTKVIYPISLAGYATTADLAGLAGQISTITPYTYPNPMNYRVYTAQNTFLTSSASVTQTDNGASVTLNQVGGLTTEVAYFRMGHTIAEIDGYFKTVMTFNSVVAGSSLAPGIGCIRADSSAFCYIYRGSDGLVVKADDFNTTTVINTGTTFTLSDTIEFQLVLGTTHYLDIYKNSLFILRVTLPEKVTGELCHTMRSRFSYNATKINLYVDKVATKASVDANTAAIATKADSAATTTALATKVNNADVISTTISVPSGNQLFDKTNYLNDTTINGAIFVYPPTSSAQNCRTMKIAVDKTIGTSLFVSGLYQLTTVAHRWLFVNSSGTVLTSGSTASVATSVFPIPDGAVFFYLTYKTAVQDAALASDTVMLNYGVSALPYESYAPPVVTKTLVSINAAFPPVVKSDLTPYALKTYVQGFQPIFGKKLITLGDSITAELTWQPTLAALKGLSFDPTTVTDPTRPMGVPGSRVVPLIAAGTPGQNAGQSIYYRADNVAFYTPDVIILMGGQNDGRDSSYNLSDAPYTGAEVSSSPPSFVSSYKGTLVKLLSQNKAAKVIAMTPMYNGNGLVPMDDTTLAAYKLRNDTIRSICAMYSVLCVDLLNNVGITPYNADTFYRDSAIHPNSAGGLRIAQYVAYRI